MVIGLDVGYGYVKAVAQDGRKVKVPSWVAVAKPGVHTELDTYELGGMRYWIGEGATFGEKVELKTIEDIVKFYPLFKQYVLGLFGVKDANVITGLPPMDYFSDKGQELKKRIGDMVLWQGLGVLMDVRDQLTDASSVAIVDIGFNTIDYVIVQRIQNKWQKVKVNSIPNVGFMRAVEVFKGLLPNSLITIKNQPTQDLITAFETRKTIYRGQVIDLSQYVEQAVNKYTALLDTLIESEIDLNKINKLVIAGGGAYYYKARHENILIPNEPEFSNARGYLRWDIG